MKNTNTKYGKLMSWITQLPPESEFFVKDAQKANGVSDSSLWLILPTLCKAGLLIRTRKLGSSSYCYKKTPEWMLEKAIEANYQRLKTKWLRFKPKN